MSRQHLSWWHLSISGKYQLLQTPFWPNFKGRLLGPSLTDTNCHRDICQGNICPGDICPIWTQNIGTNFFILISMAIDFLDPNFFGPKSFGFENFLELNYFGLKIFLDSKFCWPKIFGHQFFLPKLFLVQIFFRGPKIYIGQKNMDKEFLVKKNFWTKRFFFQPTQFWT